MFSVRTQNVVKSPEQSIAFAYLPLGKNPQIKGLGQKSLQFIQKNTINDKEGTGHFDTNTGVVKHMLIAFHFYIKVNFY